MGYAGGEIEAGSDLREGGFESGRGLAVDRAVERVALNGLAAGLADEPPEVVEVELLVRRLAGALGDVVPDDGAVEVVAAVREGELRQPDALHDPEGLYVGNVVEHQAGNGECLEVGKPRRAGQRAQLGVFGDEAQGDHAVKMRGRRREGLPLQLAEGYHVIEALRESLHVPVEHRRVGIDAQSMSRAVNLEPLVGPDLSLEDLVVNAVVENLGAAAGQRAQAGVAEGGENFA